jgi:medium-chain acyl-[acyl-carrier-protein] hydrolase
MTSTTQANSLWLGRRRPVPDARLRLFCFPYAGGTAQIYRQWPDYLPTDVEVCAIQLPGRGSRLHQPAFTRLTALVEPLTEAIAQHLDKPFAFFGHSMGALISFEVARRLRASGRREPEALFVSGRRAPHIEEPEPVTYNLPDAELSEELRRLNGTPGEVLEHPELLQLMLPILRADFEVCQTYSYTSEPPLDYPVWTLGGMQDEDVPFEHLEAWRDQTTSQFKLLKFPGDHFFLHSSQSLLLRTISGELRRIAGGASGNQRPGAASL